ncbi:MAG: hypothetical protein AB1555_02165 [Nitrospirota bacterium]
MFLVRQVRASVALTCSLITVGWLIPQFSLLPARAVVTMVNDPKGFHDIPWGLPLANLPNLKLIHSGTLIQDYELKDGSPTLGDTPVDSMRFSAVEGKFARVMIRYRGQKTHEQVLTYLQNRFGRIERIPGQMVRGLTQQYTWRGTDTEINLTYEANGERGFVFFESRTLAPRFNEGMSETGE